MIRNDNTYQISLLQFDYILIFPDWIKYDYIFSSHQCGRLGTFGESKDVETCKIDCLSKNGCNAFNLVDSLGPEKTTHTREFIQKKKTCNFLICPKPIPAPQTYSKGEAAWLFVQDYKGIKRNIQDN